jgi:hypothetical protein
MRTLIVTAGDEKFMPLVRGLVLSLQQWLPRPGLDLGFMDVGLAPASRDWVARHARHVVEPGWHLYVDPKIREEKPYLRAMTSRPFLRDLFPGYDLYCWLDGDTWVQEKFALEWLFSAAAGGAVAIVPETDRSYIPKRPFAEWRQRGIHTYFGAELAERVLWDRYFNSGVFALRADAPHWDPWARYFAEGLEASGGTYVCDQSALNAILWQEGLPAQPLPALCNWLCHSATPIWRDDIARFCEPGPPWQPIGIVHLVGETKDMPVRILRNGVETDFSLQYPGR